VATDDDITLVWHGAAHYHIYYKDLRILLDPLYTRLPGDKPHLDVTREDLDRIDYLLLTHGHLDHSWDVPYLVARHNPEVYAPEACLRDVRREVGRSDADCDETRWHGLGEIKGKTFAVADIEVTPYGIGTEEIDFWFIRSMFLRPWLHATPSALPVGIRWATHHLFGQCFAFHFRFPSRGKTLLYFGNLTAQVDGQPEVAAAVAVLDQTISAPSDPGPPLRQLPAPFHAVEVHGPRGLPHGSARGVPRCEVHLLEVPAPGGFRRDRRHLRRCAAAVMCSHGAGFRRRPACGLAPGPLRVAWRVRRPWRCGRTPGRRQPRASWPARRACRSPRR